MIEDEKTSLPKAMNRLLHSVAGKKEQNIIETLALRSMAKAIYSTDNIGHYGLAFKHYTHFTSPITTISRYDGSQASYMLSRLKKIPGGHEKYAKAVRTLIKDGEACCRS